jgi:hypothetical protein
MIANTKLEEIQGELSQELETVLLRSHGLSTFLHLANKERAVEISEHEGKFWLELCEKRDDEDDPATMTVDTWEQAVQETRKWLG